MIRIQFCCALLSLLAVCGCSGGTAPSGQTTGHKSSTAQQLTAVTPSDPELETVPEQTEPGDETLHGADAFAALVKAAEGNDQEAWAKAEKELQELGASATAALAQQLASDNRVARELAAMLLAQVGPDAASAADGLLKLLRDESTFARVNAAAALSTFDGYAEQVAPVLTDLLGDDDSNVRQTAAISLRNVGQSALPAIANLTRALKDANADVRAAAAGTLGELGPVAQKSLAALRQLTMDEDREVATTATRAIRRIDESERSASPEAIPASATK